MFCQSRTMMYNIMCFVKMNYYMYESSYNMLSKTHIKHMIVSVREAVTIYDIYASTQSII